MNTRELVEALLKEDPSGDASVMVGQNPVWFPERKPGWYDGVTHSLRMDGERVAGYVISRSGPDKVVLHTYSLDDFLDGHPDSDVDLSNLDGTPHKAEWLRVIEKLRKEQVDDGR